MDNSKKIYQNINNILINSFVKNDKNMTFNNLCNLAIEKTNSSLGIIYKLETDNNDKNILNMIALHIDKSFIENGDQTFFKKYFKNGNITIKNNDNILFKPYNTKKTHIDNNIWKNGKFPKGHPLIKRLIVSPLIIDNNVYGIIAIGNKDKDYVEEDKEWLEIIAKLTTSFIINFSNKELLVKQKDGFLSNMSNMIRKPINGIINMSRMLFDTNISSDQREYINTISKYSIQLIEIINDILDFSKLSSEKIQLTNKFFSLRNMLSSIFDILNIKITENKLDIIQHIDDDVPDFIISDQKRLTQLIMNIMSNAVKFTTNGKIILKISVSNIKDNKCTLKFIIKDTGCGISESKLNSIFKYFDKPVKDFININEESEIGLIISKFLIKLFEGDIIIESEESIGTKVTFTVKVNIAEKEFNTDKLIAKKNCKGKSFLILDKNQTERINLSNIILDLNATPTPIYSLDEAKIYVKSIKFDYILIKKQSISSDDIIDFLNTMKKYIKNSNLVLLRNIPSIIDNKFKYKIDEPVTDVKIIKLINKIEKINNPDDQNNSDKTYSNSKNKKLYSKKINILIVEYNSSNLKIIKHMLDNIGFINYNYVTNKDNMIKETLSNKYDAIFVDITTEILDGINATKIIKRKMKKKAPFIIAMTDYILDNIKKKCYDIGINGFIKKPIKFEELKAMLSIIKDKVTKQKLIKTI